jgi:hypothetical protein
MDIILFIETIVHFLRQLCALHLLADGRCFFKTRRKQMPQLHNTPHCTLLSPRPATNVLTTMYEYCLTLFQQSFPGKQPLSISEQLLIVKPGSYYLHEHDRKSENPHTQQMPNNTNAKIGASVLKDLGVIGGICQWFVACRSSLCP